MTVKELTNLLATMPQDALVVTEGYENGYDTVKKISVIGVEENSQKDWWDGKYIESKNQEAMSVVLLYSATKEANK
jgi:hypothetical protein